MVDLMGRNKEFSGAQSLGPKSSRPASSQIEGISVVVVCVVLTAIFSGLNRPLWIDEFLHFALAGQTWTEIWNYIELTSGNENHGQTWFYQILSILLLDLFGASLVGLRLVSWIATFLLLVSTYYFLRLFSIPMGLRLFVGGLLLVNRYFYFEMGNGRSYILLVATTALTAYALFAHLSNQRTRFTSRLFFGAVVTVGALNHPYFPVILGTLLTGFLVAKGMMRNEPLRATFHSLRVQLVFTILSGLLSIVIGRLTWMRETRDFSSFDPFKGFKKYGLDVGTSDFLVLTAALVVFSVLLSLWVVRLSKNSPPEPRLLIGFVLVTVGLALSVLFTWISIWRNYWIFPRQWLAGGFLVFVGFSLLAAVLFTNMAIRKLRLVKAISKLAVWVTALAMITIGASSELYAAEKNRAWWNSLSTRSLETAEEEGYRFWDIAANLNIKCGGSVWPVLVEYYNPSYSPEVALEEINTLVSSCESSN